MSARFEYAPEGDRSISTLARATRIVPFPANAVDRPVRSSGQNVLLYRPAAIPLFSSAPLATCPS
jgi:hypothetical protein